MIDPEVALELAARGATMADRHRLFAPTLLRSQASPVLAAQARKVVAVAAIEDLLA